MATNVHLPVVGLGATLRKDAWWAGPLATFVVLTSFIVYATFRAFENGFYSYGPYLSPFYSPLVETAGWGVPLLTPAMLILPGPAGFRLTCYYYRKAYYRSFGMDPPACAVGERKPHRYNGETKLFVFQNLHRFTLYVAIAFLFFLWHDFVKSLSWDDGFHAGIGSLVMLTNVTLLSFYTLSCHAFRHLVGGSLNSFSKARLGKLRHQLWKGTSTINERHALFAWLSLFGVALTDLYIRMVATGAIPDLRLF
jgi:hypothetical protein